MAGFIYNRYYWPASDTQAVCKLQDGEQDIPLVLNGTLANPATPSSLSFLDKGFTRNISITSDEDLTGVEFLIIGKQNGVTVQEPLNGGDGDLNPTVYSANSFDSITSITPSDEAAGVTVGTGTVGFLPLIQVDTPILRVLDFGVQFLPSNVNYAMYHTLFDVFRNGRTLEENLTAARFVEVVAPTNQPKIYNGYEVTNYLLISVESDPNLVDNTLEVVYLQK